GVAVSNPFLAVGTDAHETVVFATPPDGIGILQPERGGIGSGGQVDVDIGLHLPPLADQTDGGIEVAVKFAARDGAVHISRAVDFELIDAVPIDKVQGNVAEAGKVFWSREGEAAFIGLEALLLT